MAANKNNVKIHVDGLQKNFGKLKVLNGITEDVYEGEVVVVIGPSGSGKSTFLRCLNKLEEFEEGTVIVDGFEISDKKVNINEVRAALLAKKNAASAAPAAPAKSPAMNRGF